MLKRILLSLLSFLLILEITLQLGAGFTWIFYRESEEPTGAASQDRVLCIGDSFTFGMGSSSREFSYPSQLQTRLRSEVGPDWQVINGGYPGRNSRDLLERIDHQLSLHQPRFVYLMVGLNDLWTTPERLDLEGKAAGNPANPTEGFRLEYRSLRLIRWLFGANLVEDSHRPPLVVPQELVNHWSHPRLALEIHADGRVNFGGESLRAAFLPERMLVDWPDGKFLDLRWRLDGDKLELQAESWPEPILLIKRAPRPRTLAQQAARAMARDELGRAVELYALAIEEAAERSDPLWHSREIEGLLRLGRHEDAERATARIRARYETSDEGVWAQALCYSLSLAGKREDCLAVSSLAIEKFPDNADLLRVHAWESFQNGQIEVGIRTMEAAIALVDRQHEAGRIPTRHKLVPMLRESDPLRAIQVIAELHLLGDRSFKFERLIRSMAEFIDLPAVQDALTSTDLPESEQTVLLTTFTELYARDDSPMEVVEFHLEQIITRIHESGAEAILCTYPRHNGQIRAIHDRLSLSTAAARLDIARAFEDALEVGKKSDLFVPDGHCNDRGYALIAERILDDLRQRL